MPAVSFSGETSRGPFWLQILLGLKTTTIRAPSSRIIISNDPLYLYWKQRVAVRLKPIHMIATVRCVTIQYGVLYSCFANIDHVARSDGFYDHTELQEWFGDVAAKPEPRWNIIHWGRIPDDAVITNREAIVNGIDVLDDVHLQHEYHERLSTVLNDIGKSTATEAE